MDLEQANISNLKSLWQKYGVQILNSNSGENSLLSHPQWPFRAWADQPMTVPLTEDARSLLEHISPEVKLPLMPIYSSQTANGKDHKCLSPLADELAGLGWSQTLEQTAMYLPLSTRTKGSPKTDFGYRISQVQSSEALQEWASVVESAFAYQVDIAALERVLNDPDITLLSASDNKQVVATALLYKTGDVVGLHQMGVKQGFQGRGIAKGFMLDLIERSRSLKANFVVLQASVAGAPLYRSLGFIEQFKIKSFQRQPEA